LIALRNLQVIDYINNIGCIIVHLMGGRATAPILALPVCLTMLNKHQGLAIALFFAYGHAYAAGAWKRKNVFSYAKQTGNPHLYAAQLRNPG